MKMPEYVAVKIMPDKKGTSYNLEVVTDADFVNVVRCKNCAMWEKRYPNEQGFMCCPSSGMDITENDFCSWGEKVTE